MMLRKNFPLILLAFIALSANAQERTYVISPTNSIVESVSASEEFVKYYIYQENTTDKDLILGWNRLHADIPGGWDYSLCDLGTCYPGIPEGEHTMDTTAPGEKAFLAMNIYPYGVTGTANIKIAVWDVNNPSIVDTLAWVITVTPSADVTVAPEKTFSLRVYPNPTSDHVVVSLHDSRNGKLLIFNSVGNRAFDIATNGRSDVEFDISTFVAGAYTVLFTAEDGTTSSTTFIKR